MAMRTIQSGSRVLLALFVGSLAVACSAASSDDPLTLIPADETITSSSEGVSGSLPIGTTLETTGNLNLRSGPSTSYKVLRVMPKGSLAVTVERTTPSGRYYKLEYDGTIGWASGNYLRVAATGGGDEEPPPVAGCDGFDTEPLLRPVKCDGPGGNTTSTIPSNGLYSSSWFGCYRKADGTLYKDPYDNCEFACGSKGYCPTGQSGPECEANLMWFAADADRYGCGGLIRVTNCQTGRSVVLVTLDRGPNCNSVEKSCSTPVLDMSRPAMEYLFDGKLYGGCDHKRVLVEKVAAGTPLGPVQ